MALAAIWNGVALVGWQTFGRETTGPPVAATRTSYVDAKRILYELREELLPLPLRRKPPTEQEAIWPQWVSAHDAAIRARLDRGDEDSIINLVLFGVSFTGQSRIDIREMLRLVGESQGERLLESAVLQSRIDDMIAGIASPDGNERLLFARHVVRRRTIDPDASSNRTRIREYLEDGVRRVLAEYEQSPRGDGPAGPYAARGLSSDTSLLPDFAIEQALAAIKARGLLPGAGVARLAVIGPGLDFADKRDGHDFYPQQTLQPFAVIDSLLRLGVSTRDGLRVTTFDLSPRINDHLETARRHARAGDPYQLVLTRDASLPWHAELTAYWTKFGDRIGDSISTVRPPPAAGRVDVRAIRVRPAVVLSVLPRDLNIVLERLDLSADADQFDLIVGTNVLTYYDAFEQSLALANIAAMLRPGGLFLSNDPVVVLPAVPLNAVGATAVQYTDLPNSQDEIVWYRR